jgi:porin
MPSLRPALLSFFLTASTLFADAKYDREHYHQDDFAVPEDESECTCWKDYLDQEHLFNDWLGYGHEMRKSGFDLNGYFTADLLGNPVGGMSQGFDAASSMGMQLVVDFDTLVGLKGTQFITSMIWRAGDNLSADHIGNLFTVAQLYGGQNLRLYEFMLRQKLFDDQLVIEAGRTAAFDRFLSFPIFWNYVNNGIDGNPKGIFFSVPAFGQTVYPTSSWGLFSKWQPADQKWYLQAGGYLLDSDDGANSTSGLNWTFDVDLGPAAFVQTGYHLNDDVTDTGLPGDYAIGAFVSGDNQPKYLSPTESQSNAGGYIFLQQMLFTHDHSEANLKRKRNFWGPGAMEGLTAFTAIVITPMDSISMFPLYVDGGLTYQGIIPGRPDDFLSFGVMWGEVSDELQQSQGPGHQTYEAVLELNYRYFVTPFFYIQPDVQYVIQPGATDTIENALVLGAQVSVNF